MPDPELEIHALGALAAGLQELRVGADTSPQEASAAFRALGGLQRCTLGMIRFYGLTPWERHTQDEFLYVLDGEVELTVLPLTGRRIGVLRAGHVTVAPGGSWHRQHARMRTTFLFITGDAAHSTADDPRSTP